jgi:hypothetical protein
MFKKLGLFISLTVLSTTSIAEWVKVASTLDDDAIFYVSTESIKITGKNTKSVWEVVNHPNYSRQGYLSVKVQQEYDCNSNKVRTLLASAHSELFGKGKTITIAQKVPLPWQVMPEGSVATFARDYICSQKEK